MSQKRYFNWKEDDKTDFLNRQHLAILPEGLYRGFEYDATSSGSSLKLKHTSATAYKEVFSDGSESAYQGMFRTRQGVNTVEDATLTISITTNALNANPRWDLIVANHQYTAVVGGTAATYSQILGTPGVTPAYPALTDPLTQTILGYIKWDGSEANIATAEYIRATPPAFGNQQNIVYTDTDQVITGSKRFQHIMSTPEVLTLNTGTDTLSSTENSNHYILYNVNSNAEPVTTLTIPYTGDGGTAIKITTDQDLIIMDTVFGGGNIRLLYAVSSQMHVKAGETIELYAIKGTNFPTTMANAGVMYLVTKAPEVVRNKINKLYAGLIGNKATATYNNTHKTMVLSGKGNYYQFNFNSSTQDTILRGITSFASYGDSYDSNSNSGHTILVRFNDSSGLAVPCSIQHNYVGLASPYVNILTSNSAVVTVEQGGYGLFVEDNGSYRLVMVMDSQIDNWIIGKKYLDVNQYIERKFHKSISTGWKDLGVNPITAGGILVITDEGNSFQATVPNNDNGGFIKDIHINRGGIISSCPTGMVINVRFIHQTITWGVNVPFLIDLTGNIRAPFSQFNRDGGSTGELWIMDGYTNVVGHTFTFRKTATAWDIIATNYEAEIYDKLVELQITDQSSFNGAWLTPTPLNNWNVLNTPVLKYRKQGYDCVRLKGLISATTTGYSNPAFTLPLGYRPLDTCIFIAYNTGGVTSTVAITAAGNVNITFSAPVSAGTSVYFDGIEFPTN